MRLLWMMAVVVLAACGTDDTRPEAQPSVDDPRFVEGAFDQLPHYPRSEPVGVRTEEKDTVAQSYEARNATPELIMEYYAEALDDWTVVDPVEKLGTEAYRGVWARDDLQLIVSATSGPTLSQEDEVSSQYSLSLRPR